MTKIDWIFKDSSTKPKKFYRFTILRKEERNRFYETYSENGMEYHHQHLGGAGSPSGDCSGGSSAGRDSGFHRSVRVDGTGVPCRLAHLCEGG